MTKTKTAPKRPTHRVNAVIRIENDDKSYWTTSGAAWRHQDGKVFNVKLEYLALNGAEIIIREQQPEQSPTKAD